MLSVSGMATSGSDTDNGGGRRRECMNSSCGISSASASASWRKGWPLRSGGFADLCDKCGSAYEQSIFCEVFHTNDSGWRKCFTCGKNLHCGCAASRLLVELLDRGGVSCTGCCRNSAGNQVNGDEKPSGLHNSRADEVDETHHSVAVINRLDTEDELRLPRTSTEGTSTRNLLQLENDKANGFPRQMKQEDNLPSAADICEAAAAAKDLYESMAQASLSTNPGLLLGSLNAFPGIVVNERPQFQSKASSPVQQGSRSRHLLPKPPKSGLATGLEPNGGGMFASQVRVARPPAEGRGRNQLLPRYWPRITDQELQQLSGDSNSTIVPLFEKVLSASDAGRIGRLVLPKACAEAYFPPISQPEGLPLRIQDVKGKEWVFQFRFWPNNNSRMYVLEGVTPCIQSMQLQAGDTVTFSRMDPEGKLVMGFRKASITNNNMQDSQPAGLSNGNHPSDRLFSGVFDNLPIISGYSGLLHTLKGSSDAQLSAISKGLHPEGSWHKVEKQEMDAKEGLLPQSLLFPERKRSRNIGSKSKRLLFDGLDALELKLTWEEAQELLCPPPTTEPSVVTIEDHDFEEYDEPPVFGKKSIFVARSTGGQEQWAQCDSCAKWRRLPVDVLLPPKWTCQDNSWDQTRCSCSAPDELTPREMESLLRLNMDFKRRKLASVKQVPEQESSGLDTLATAAILGDIGGPSTPAVAATTKHPRHRPGCSCIVCIQPPSGKGKHKPNCTCNVCMTVKRRFKTMMMRKKKRQSEREAEIAQRNQHTWGPKEEVEVDNSSKHASSPLHTSDSNGQNNNSSNKLSDANKGHIDLNFHPDQDSPTGLTRLSMMSLLQVASRPLDTYLKQNGLAGLVADEQASSASRLQPQAGENDGEQLHEDSQTPSPAAEQESGGEENNASHPDDSQNEAI